MNETEQIVHEVNGFLCALGDEPLQFPVQTPLSELDLLLAVKTEYTARLRAKVPAYRSLPSDTAIPDLFLEALRSREAELEGRLH
ncbi:MAG TPA: hypothetical protein PKM43_02950 [Verrucomicrobiota bacterium]|nr:hypothetical protein [Verrucomicrobiota bacterium]